ncbi:efflux RND transporter periplasmic adaptor subunit [Fluviicola taffensis]|uniref:Efflux transporter, RND family, MFP subunit n=1 Tax=Fluviicola taffensis (strain DSM 16823 / NCIMB 13979 / RW262) TaxID=755732 RepID=F2IB28_FLUTR|nr:efflux RND transporter periplasmic adaptor subunit [Fluviicola taffensis]AEA42111.1 efflux transporter, RND family, MFP subunit [Fluviicola taffensis DSM 16823]
MKTTRNNIRIHFGIACCSLILGACKSNEPEMAIETFTMSDSMLKKCAFYTTSNEVVKNNIRLFGKIEADNNKMAQIYPILSGVVTSIHVGLGDYVKQGQIMARIQSVEIAGFQKEYLDATNDVITAEKNLQVAKDLFSGKLNSERDIAMATKELEMAKAELKRIKEIYKIYNLKSGSSYNIVAPMSGFVITKTIFQNEQLRSTDAEALFTIAETKEIWAVANVNEIDISKIKEGYDVTVQTLAFPDHPYEAKIQKIYNVIDAQTKSMKIRISIPNEDFKLKPEMNCTVDVHYSENKQLISIPSSSIIFDKNKYWVMVFKNKHDIETREVEVYRELGKTSYIQTGLKPGEKIISDNGLLIYDALND